MPSSGAIDAGRSANALRALRRGLLRSEGFSLFVAVCNRPIDRDALIKQLAESMPGSALRTIALNKDTTDPLKEIERKSAAGDGGPIMLVGLENAVPSSADDHPVLHALNLRRQEWPRQVSHPVVLWIPEYLLGLLGRTSPDFLDWRSDTFHFDKLTDSDLLPFRSQEWAGGLDAYMPPAARRERIKELRSRIAVSPHADDPVVLDAHVEWLNEIGNHYHHFGEFAEAKRTLESAVEIAEKHPEPDHPNLAASYSNLATIVKDLGDLPEARRLMERVIGIDQKHLEADHPNLAVSCSNLALIVKDLGDLPEARRLMERAIEIDQKHLEADHPTLAIRYSNLAMIVQDLGDLPEARRLMEQAIQINQKHFEADHPNLATCHSNLAMIVQDLGDLPEARRLMEQAIEIDQKHFEADHPTLAIRYNNLAGIVRDVGDLPEARRLIERAIEILEKNFKPDHRYLIGARERLASILAAETN